MTDVIRMAVALFKWVIEKKQNGYKIYAIPEGGKEGDKEGERVELLLPI
ncbi:MAG: hypothetical protein PHR36_03010 [Patescibacteria group bacterium]|nr:hypothetical protein [Patescibacteria group bacterium]